MPIYEYQCKTCDHEFEALQKMSDDPLVDCDKCGKPELVKKISAAAFRLSGSGWYETDFKSGKKKNLAGDNDSQSGASESNGAAKNASDKKPVASKTSSKSSSSE